MEKNFNNNFENEFNDNTSITFLEEFFSKEINNSLTPQEIMILSLSLNYVLKMLALYSTYSNIAVFDIKEFISKHPEYSDLDFNNINNIDEDTLKDIDSLLHDETGKTGEEFNKGDILLQNIMNVILNIASKLYNSYTEEYSKESPPPDTEQFFTMLDKCLQNNLMILKSFFTQRY